MASLLPQSEGFLPLYVLFAGITAVGNAGQCYRTLEYTQRLYSGQPKATKEKSAPAHSSPATALSSRTFGTWTMAVGIVRIFAAYHINEASWYQMQMVANVIGLMHFGLEAFVFKTCRPSGPWLAPMSVATIGLVWSILQYSFYVR